MCWCEKEQRAFLQTSDCQRLGCNWWILIWGSKKWALFYRKSLYNPSLPPQCPDATWHKTHQGPSFCPNTPTAEFKDTLYSPKMSTKMLNYLSNKMWANSSFIVHFIKLWACILLGKNIKVCFKDTITLTSSCVMVYSFKNLTCCSLPPQRLSAINQGRNYPATQLPSKSSGLRRAGLGEWDSKPIDRPASEEHVSALHPNVYPSPSRPEEEARNSSAKAVVAMEKPESRAPHVRTHRTLEPLTQTIPQTVPLRTLLVSEQLLHIPVPEVHGE